MATTTTTDLLTPRPRKRRSTFDDTVENSPHSMDDLSTPDAPHKIKRFRPSRTTTIGVSGIVEDLDPFQASQFTDGRQLPENSQIHDSLPVIQTPSTVKAEEPARIDLFLDDVEMRTKRPAKFLVVLKSLLKEDGDKLSELGLDEDYNSGYRMRVSWMQFARLMDRKLVKEVEGFPENYWQVMMGAEAETAKA